MKKPIAAVAIAATTLGGVAAGATLLTPGIAGAQDDAETQTFDTFSERVSEVLQPLVDDGTNNDSQRDAVVGQLEANRPEPGDRGHGPGRRGPGHGAFGGEIAEILGLEGSEIAEALQSGQSLSDLATANNVDPQDLVDAIVAAAEERVNGALDAGHIDADKAAEILDSTAERAEDIVNGEFEPGGHRGGPGGPGFPGGPDDGAGSDAPASA
jgi:hypothetical protein